MELFTYIKISKIEAPDNKVRNEKNMSTIQHEKY